MRSIAGNAPYYMPTVEQKKKRGPDPPTPSPIPPYNQKQMKDRLFERMDKDRKVRNLYGLQHPAQPTNMSVSGFHLHQLHECPQRAQAIMDRIATQIKPPCLHQSSGSSLDLRPECFGGHFEHIFAEESVLKSLYLYDRYQTTQRTITQFPSAMPFGHGNTSQKYFVLPCCQYQ